MKKKYLGRAQAIAQKYADTPMEERKSWKYELGIDEAGRGPIFGSMIFSALWWPLQLSQELGGLGFTDSKKLSENERQQLYDILQVLKDKVVFYAYTELTAQYISNKMLAEYGQMNLNILSHNAAIGLIQRALADGFIITNAFLDTVGPCDKYRKKIEDSIQSPQTTVEVCPKADLKYKVVSAASIVAKVTRDHVLRDWKFQEQIEPVGQLGSGYPSDPRTVSWLERNLDPVFGYPNLIRFSWSTFDDQAADKCKLKFKKPNSMKAFELMNKKYGLISQGAPIFE